MQTDYDIDDKLSELVKLTQASHDLLAQIVKLMEDYFKALDLI